MAFKIAYGAGHRLETAGKCFPKALDPACTPEWVVNDRVARYFAEAAAQYDGVELLRVDDPAGHAAVSLSQRVAAANRWGADFCLAIHHNAGAKLTAAGGIVAFVGPGVGALTKTYQKALYDACISATGLEGNRATPLATGDLYVCNMTKAPCVLMELGFMDSTHDAPIIIKDDYSRKVGYALMEGIAEVAGLKKKEEEEMTQEMFNAMMDRYLTARAQQPASNWAEKEGVMKWAKETGVMAGDDHGNQMPRAFATREEIAAMLYRLSK